jgi:hypothetical protein
MHPFLFLPFIIFVRKILKLKENFMAKRLENVRISMLILVTLIGFIIGSYLSLLIGMIPGDYVVVKELFTFNLLPISIGYPSPAAVDLSAVKFQFGFQLEINIMSIIGVFIALWAYRWYK